MSGVSFRLADEGNWSGGGKVFLSNYRAAARQFPLLAGEARASIDVIPRNVPLEGLRRRRPYVLVPQNAWPWTPVSHGLKDALRVWMLRAASEASLRRAAAVLRISSAIPQRRHGIWSSVIHNVLDQGFEQDIARSHEEKVGAAEGAIVSIGSINAYRGFDVLCSAHRELGGFGERPALFVAGKPSNPSLAESIRRKFQARDVTVHLGELTRPQCLAAYRDAALVVLPSRVEASPLTALEAVAVTPRVLLSDVQGHREILSEYTQLGVEGWFDSRTPAALARALSSATSGAFCEAHLRLRSENAREVARRLWAERVESWLRSVSAELSTRR